MRLSVAERGRGALLVEQGMSDLREHDADQKGGRDDGDEEKRGFEALEKNGSRPCPNRWPALSSTGPTRYGHRILLSLLGSVSSWRRPLGRVPVTAGTPLRVQGSKR